MAAEPRVQGKFWPIVMLRIDTQQTDLICFRASSCAPIQVLEVEDEADEWGPPGIERELQDPAVRDGERGAGQGQQGHFACLY